LLDARPTGCRDGVASAPSDGVTRGVRRAGRLPGSENNELNSYFYRYFLHFESDCDIIFVYSIFD